MTKFPSIPEVGASRGAENPNFRRILERRSMHLKAARIGGILCRLSLVHIKFSSTDSLLYEVVPVFPVRIHAHRFEEWSVDFSRCCTLRVSSDRLADRLGAGIAFEEGRF